MSIGTIILAILIFSVLIFVHELGHFIACRLSGISVNEFAIGMGPKLISRTRGETTYSIRAFPVGGFCAMEGEDEDSYDPHAFCNASLPRRFFVMVAGSVMNLLLGLILVGILSTQLTAFGSNVVGEFNEGAITNQQLQIDDQIIRMDGHRVRTLNDIDYELSRSRTGMMDIEVIRGGEKIVLKDVQFAMQNIDGVSFINMDFKVRRIEPSFGGVITNTFNWTRSLIKQVWGSFIDLITMRYTVNQMSGPVGVTTAISQATTMGWRSVMLLVSIITLNLGVFNLLPVPALDGGRLLFLIIEMVRRKPVNPRYEGLVHGIGFALLIALMVFVSINDVRKLIMF